MVSIPMFVEQLLTFADLKEMDTVSSTVSEIYIYMQQKTEKERERGDTTRLTRHLHGCCPESLCLLANFLGNSLCFSTH